MKLKIKLAVAALSLSFTINSQNNSNSSGTGVQRPGCGTKPPTKEWDAWFNKKVEEYKENKALGKATPASLTIPVIMHVIHGGQGIGGYPNLSVAQLKSQIGVLNKDFAGQGLNVGQLAATGFSTVGAADTKITFCLAQFDPNGQPLTEPGIDRVNYVAQGWPNPTAAATSAAFQSYMDNTVKPATIWDPTYYLNIWVSDVNPNAFLLGYATFPLGSGLSGVPGGGSGASDGIWVWARCFGNTGTLDPSYNKGRTATHELGHWLGLRHIGGDATNPNGDCNATDFCNDTPPQKGGANTGTNGQNYGTPAYPLHVNICGSPFGDMFMNFMDYCDDVALYMFTPDQNDRIQTAMVNGLFRNLLNTSAATQCSGLPLGDFLMDPVSCVGADVGILNQVAGSAGTTYSWSAEPSSGVSFVPNSTDPNPAVNFGSSGIYTVYMTSSNTVGITSYSTTIQIDECVGLAGSGQFGQNIHLLPNPSSGNVNVSMEFAKEQNIKISVHNSLGQLVISTGRTSVAKETVTIDMSGYPDGVYTLTISNGEENLVKRVILNK